MTHGALNSCQVFRLCIFNFSYGTYKLILPSSKQQGREPMALNPRPARGVDAPRLRFLGDSVKTAARSAAKFDIACEAIFPHVLKILGPSDFRSGH